MVRVVVVVVRVSVGGQVFVGDRSVRVVVVVLVVVVVVVGSSGPEALEALELLGHLVGPYEGFHRVLRGEVERLRVHLLVAVGHPVEVLQVGLLLGGAEAGRRRHRTTGGADRGGGHRSSRLEARAVPARPIDSAEGLLLHVEFHQVEVIDVLHGQGAGGQLGTDAQLASHRGGAGWGRVSSPGGGRRRRRARSLASSLQGPILPGAGQPEETFSSPRRSQVKPSREGSRGDAPPCSRTETAVQNSQLPSCASPARNPLATEKEKAGAGWRWGRARQNSLQEDGARLL